MEYARLILDEIAKNAKNMSFGAFYIQLHIQLIYNSICQSMQEKLLVAGFMYIN